jgi:hypothetical protein
MSWIPAEARIQVLSMDSGSSRCSGRNDNTALPVIPVDRLPLLRQQLTDMNAAMLQTGIQVLSMDSGSSRCSGRNDNTPPVLGLTFLKLMATILLRGV